MIHAYLGYNNVVIQKKKYGHRSWIKEISERNASAIDSTYFINKDILSPGYYVYHINEEVPNSI
jgi:hypothetical protein